MNNILLIEEDKDLAKRLISEFRAENYDVYFCDSRESAESYITNGSHFDAVVLDWFFENPEDSVVSRLILRKLKGKHFKPVFIYTDNQQNFEQTNPDEIGYPQNLLSCHSKGTGCEELLTKIKVLLGSNISLQLANTYRETIQNTLESILFELNEVPNIDLSKIFHRVYGDGENVDWSNDIILNLLHRSMISNNEFIERITTLLKNNTPAKSKSNSPESKRIANKILYFEHKSELIRNGDIISVSKGKDVILLGVIVTPDCDLEHNNTRYLEMIEIVQIDDARLNVNAEALRDIRAFKNGSLYFFPSINNNNTFRSYVAVLKSKVIIRELNIDISVKYPSASQRLTYKSRFLLNSEEVSISLLCSLSNPYKSEFLHKLHSSNSRVGIPDIKDLFN